MICIPTDHENLTNGSTRIFLHTFSEFTNVSILFCMPIHQELKEKVSLGTLMEFVSLKASVCMLILDVSVDKVSFHSMLI